VSAAFSANSAWSELRPVTKLNPEAGAEETTESPGEPYLPTILLGAIAVGLGAVVIADAARIHAPAGQSFVGPAAFPFGVGVLLIAAGGGLASTRAVGWIRSTPPAPARTRDTGRAVKVLALLGLLIAYAAVLPRLSYVLSTAALFSGAALLFGSGHRLRTIAIGVVLAAVVFVAFAHGIGVSLPAGSWGF
jgi:putative tricarboxylic transport membrane protein